MSRPLELLARRDLVVVTGKGGVGKTVLAAALGRGLAARGRRTVVLEVDPRESLHQVFAASPSGGALVDVAATPGLRFQNLRPRQVLDELVRRHLRLGALAGRLLRSPVYAHVAEGAPGLKELAVLLHAQELVGGRPGRAPECDVVVLDAPATGHALSLLAAPGLVCEVVQSGPFGRLASELGGWLGDPRRSALVVVTTAEEMPVEEALELVAAFPPALGRGADLLAVNGLYPPLPVPAPPAPAELLALWRERRAVNQRELRRLTSEFRGPRAELPLLPLDRGPELLAALAESLGARSSARGGTV